MGALLPLSIAGTVNGRPAQADMLLMKIMIRE